MKQKVLNTVITIACAIGLIWIGLSFIGIVADNHYLPDTKEHSSANFFVVCFDKDK